MKKLPVCLVMLLAYLAELAAHQPVELPEPGQVDLSLEYRAMGGREFIDLNLYNMQTSQWAGLNCLFFDPAYNGSGMGLNSMIEVGVLPGWSLGLTTNIPQFLLNGLQQDSWDINLAIHTNVRLLQEAWYTLNLHGQVNALPLIETSSVAGLNLLNAYLTIGSGFTLDEWKGGKFSAYVDLKLQSTFFSPLHQSVEEYLRNNVEYTDATGTVIELPQGAYYISMPVQRLALGVGLDLELDGFFVNLGWNFPIVKFALGLGQIEGFEYGLSHMDLINLELSWRVRL